MNICSQETARKEISIYLRKGRNIEGKDSREGEIRVSVYGDIGGSSIFSHAHTSCIFTCRTGNGNGRHFGINLANTTRLRIWIM